MLRPMKNEDAKEENAEKKHRTLSWVAGVFELIDTFGFTRETLAVQLSYQAETNRHLVVKNFGKIFISAILQSSWIDSAEIAKSAKN